MRLKNVIASALLMATIGMVTTACGTVKDDPNSFQFVDNRRDS